MKKVLVAMLLVLASGCMSSMLKGISNVAQRDMADAIAINIDPAVQDKRGEQCTFWLNAHKPTVQRVLEYPTSGPLSKIAKRRALEILAEQMRPGFEIACAPVLMDERVRLARYAAFFGRL